ncbi:ExsB family protein, partial [human gut metagenome]
NNAKIQVPENQITIVINKRSEILTYFKSMFDAVLEPLQPHSVLNV